MRYEISRSARNVIKNLISGFYGPSKFLKVQGQDQLSSISVLILYQGFIWFRGTVKVPL